MTEPISLGERFEQQRPRLRGMAYRMLGSVTDADDAVQETWLRASRADASGVEDLGAWLTTIVARVSLNALRSRAQRREDPLESFAPEPILSRPGGAAGPLGDPEHEAMLADSVGIALLVVLETLTPAERLAFVLHDLFAVPFDEIAPMIERTPDAARQLASRARRRVRGQAPSPDPDLARQRKVVDAFFSAARGADFQSLVAILHPDAVFRATGLTPVPFTLSGAETVARNARMFGPQSPEFRPALVNAAAGVIVVEGGVLKSITAFTVTEGRIIAIDVLADAERLSRYDLSALRE